MYKNLSCPSCKNDIFAKDINIEKAIAKCAKCHTVFSFEEEVLETPPHREEIFVIPKGIEMLKLFGELNIEVQWRHNASAFLTIFTLIWNGFLLPFVVIAILTGTWEMLLGISLHLLVGVGFGYWSLATLFNTTYITVDEYHLKIQHAPFKLFFKSHEIPVGDIDQLYVEKYSNGSTNGKPNYVYAVTAILKDTSEVKIIKGLNKPLPAQYIEQEIEKFAKIKNRLVEGEFGR